MARITKKQKKLQEMLADFPQPTSGKEALVKLQEISKELISHSHKKKGISSYIFEKYFDLPSMLSHRLFTVFNNNEHKEYLSGDNFIENMLNLFTGGFNELTDIIFRLFDFKNDRNITSDEISIILSYIPISHKNYDNKKFRFEQDEFIDRIQSQEEISLALDILFVNKKSITYNEFVELAKKTKTEKEGIQLFNINGIINELNKEKSNKM